MENKNLTQLLQYYEQTHHVEANAFSRVSLDSAGKRKEIALCTMLDGHFSIMGEEILYYTQNILFVFKHRENPAFIQQLFHDAELLTHFSLISHAQHSLRPHEASASDDKKLATVMYSKVAAAEKAFSKAAIFAREWQKMAAFFCQNEEDLKKKLLALRMHLKQALSQSQELEKFLFKILTNAKESHRRHTMVSFPIGLYGAYESFMKKVFPHMKDTPSDLPYGVYPKIVLAYEGIRLLEPLFVIYPQLSTTHAPSFVQKTIPLVSDAKALFGALKNLFKKEQVYSSDFVPCAKIEEIIQERAKRAGIKIVCSSIKEEGYTSLAHIDQFLIVLFAFCSKEKEANFSFVIGVKNGKICIKVTSDTPLYFLLLVYNNLIQSNDDEIKKYAINITW